MQLNNVGSFVAMTCFACITEDEWRLSPAICCERRRRLMSGMPYEDIVDRIVSQAEIVCHKRQRSSNHSGSRFYVRLRVRPETVDLFHNSHCGYRAQYYDTPEKGECANRYLIDHLMPRLRVILREDWKRTCPPDWVEASLSAQSAKVWIRQGRWLRRNAIVDRNLCIVRWSAGLNNGNDRHRKLARWAILTPIETMLVVKGGWLDNAGLPIAGCRKPCRSQELYQRGFT